MKGMRREVLFAVLLAWVMPWLIMGIFSVCGQSQTRQVQQTQPTYPEVSRTAESRKIWVLRDGSRKEMELEEYVVGVLLGELPGGFHMEAQKAQAIVTRTYTLRTVLHKDKHAGAVCTDSTCCQAYRDPAAYLAQGGSAQTLDRTRQAVEQTAGTVLTYHGELIDATYFSCSGGTTEDAVAVWGSDVPYLQSVESPGEEFALRHTDTVTFTPEEFSAALGMELSGSPTAWFGAVSYTRGGSVDQIYIGGVAWSGTRLRGLLGLRSAAFSLCATDTGITVTTKGFGHRVGMSQYGAEAMARAGNTASQILAHYYTGTELTGAYGQPYSHS